MTKENIFKNLFMDQKETIKFTSLVLDMNSHLSDVHPFGFMTYLNDLIVLRE